MRMSAVDEYDGVSEELRRERKRQGKKRTGGAELDTVEGGADEVLLETRAARTINGGHKRRGQSPALLTIRQVSEESDCTGTAPP